MTIIPSISSPEKNTSVTATCSNVRTGSFLRRTALSLLVASALGFTLSACGGNETATSNVATASQNASQTSANTPKEAVQELKVIKIAYLPITHSLPALALSENTEAALKLGFKVELVRYGSWPELLDALNTGHVDAAPVLAELAMKAHEQGLGLKAVASGHVDGNVFIASNKVQTGADLKGRTVAIPHRQSSHYLLLLEVLKRAGLTKDDIKITELAPAEMPAALASGQIDAYCVAEPFGATAEVLGLGHVLYTSEELWPDSLCCLLILSKAFQNQEPKLVKDFLNLYLKTGQELTDKSKALDIASRYLKQNQETLEKSLAYISFADLKISEAAYNTLKTKVSEAGLSQNPPAYEEFVIHE